MTLDQETADLISGRLFKYDLKFYHSPSMWMECEIPVTLNWKSVRFSEENRHKIPRDEFGVYVFMLQPDIAGPPTSKYLMYVGKTEANRRFLKRYSDYIGDVKSPKFATSKIVRMLKKWNGYIWFYYASIEDVNLVDDIETSLMNACIPPGNRRFKGSIGKAIEAFKQDRGES